MKELKNLEGIGMVFYPRQLTARLGSMIFHVPRIRDGNFSTEMF